MSKYPCPVSGKKNIYPSVTTIIGDCVPKDWGPQWGANQAIEFIKEQAYYNEESDEYTLYSDLLNSARFHFREVSQKALDIGSEVHKAVEDHLKGIVPTIKDIKAETAYIAFLEWEKENDLQTVDTEKKVYASNWAGTLDWRGYINGKGYVVDFKTSKAFYPEMRYQVAAYRATCEVLSDVMIEGCGILRLDKETGLPSWHDTSKTYANDLKVFFAMVELYYLRHPIIAKKFREATE